MFAHAHAHANFFVHPDNQRSYLTAFTDYDTLTITSLPLLSCMLKLCRADSTLHTYIYVTKNTKTCISNTVYIHSHTHIQTQESKTYTYIDRYIHTCRPNGPIKDDVIVYACMHMHTYMHTYTYIQT